MAETNRLSDISYEYHWVGHKDSHISTFISLPTLSQTFLALRTDILRLKNLHFVWNIFVVMSFSTARGAICRLIFSREKYKMCAISKSHNFYDDHFNNIVIVLLYYTVFCCIKLFNKLFPLNQPSLNAVSDGAAVLQCCSARSVPEPDWRADSRDQCRC